MPGRNYFAISQQHQQQPFQNVQMVPNGRSPLCEARALPLEHAPKFGHQGHTPNPSLSLPDTPLRDCPTPISARAVCKQCGIERNSVSFCPVCAINYCEYHWRNQPLHQQPQENQRSMHGVPHERTDPELVERILSIIEPTASEQEQQQMHLEDENTSWFGVLADSAGDLYFHDWGRYEEFFAQSRAGSKNVQFPGLISFVGPTGAGKSTIVKALVKLFQKDHKQDSAQAPVVGLTEHQAVPTSGAVHLYWDYDRLFSEMPLLFADCEGLGGGSREPMSERAASKKGKNVLTKKDRSGRSRAYSRSDSPDNVIQDLQESQHRKSFKRASAHHSSSPPSYPGRPISPSPYSQTITNHRASLVDSSLDFSPPPFHLASQTASPYLPVAESRAPNDGFTPGREKSFRGFIRPLKWATGDRRNRQYIVENLYPRLLYTFSDAVVLVMRNAKYSALLFQMFFV
jgi:energy-coupling factor transporter ATP-binding protein EcfA2